MKEEHLIYFSATPQGVMPLLEVDGKVLLYQSFAIARYVARECRKYHSSWRNKSYVNEKKSNKRWQNTVKNRIEKVKWW